MQVVGPGGRQPIVIIGGGAAAAFLLHQLAADGAGLRPVVVVDPVERLGPGLAYGTTDPVHLMNVCRVRLSVDGDDGADLAGWLARRGIAAHADTYLRRSTYGDYLSDVASRSGAAVGLDHRRARVVDVTRVEGGWEVALDDGDVVRAGDVVLATGFPGRVALPCAVPDRHDPRIVVDPWAPGALDRPDAERVLIVGTGLTMVDVALSLGARNPDVELVAASRRGLVPRASRPGLPTPIDPERLPTPGHGDRALVRHVIRLGREQPDQWQSVIDSVRPLANDLWRGLAHDEQARLLQRWFPWWNVHRHRTAPAVGAGLAAAIARGQLRIVRSRVASLESRERVRVRFGDPRLDQLDVDLVVNAAGPGEDLAAGPGPVLGPLLDQGHLAIGPHRLGLAVDRAGRAIGRGTDPTPGLWIIGALRRGTEWETTAVPEIRVQAGVIADRLLAGQASTR